MGKTECFGNTEEGVEKVREAFSEEVTYERLVRWGSKWVGWERVVPAEGTACTKAYKQSMYKVKHCRPIINV